MSHNRDLFNVVIGKTDQTVNSVMVNEDSFGHLERKIIEFIASHPAYDFVREEKFAESFIWQAIGISNMINLLGYQNVLVVPSFRDSAFSTLYDHSEGGLRTNLVSQLWPIVNAHFHQSAYVCTAYPDDHVSFCKDIGRHFESGEVSSNKRYVMGDDTYWVHSDILFDAVFLAGQPLDVGQTFVASDIKNDFASMCTEDFDLIDLYEREDFSARLAVRNGTPLPPRPTRLTGENKDIREFAEHINNSSIKLSSSDNDAFTAIMSNHSRILERVMQVY